MKQTHAIRTVASDVLVVGGGMAGCFAAVKARAAGASVTVVDKGSLGKAGQTPFAGGMLIFNEEWGDELDAWMEQIAVYGDHLNRRDWTELCFRESHARYEDLVSWGVQFERDAAGELLRGGVPLGPCKASHMGTRTPSLKLRRQVERSGACIVDRTMVSGLLKGGDAVVGAVGFPLDRDEVVVFRAGAVVLAAGAGGLKVPGWPIGDLTSDGDAMAYRAGATITGKEFVDPHASRADQDAPSAFGSFGRPGDGGRPRFGPVVNAEGDELRPTGTLFLSFEFEAHAGRAPLTMKLKDEDVRVVGGAASGMSVHKAEGVWPAGLDCSSDVPGLYAAGDALGTMQTGATYAAIGQSIANCAVTGARAGEAAAGYAAAAAARAAATADAAAQRAVEDLLAPLRRRGGFSPRWVTQVLQNTMLPYFVMYVKHGDRLQAALTTVEFLRDHLVPKLYARDQHELRLAHETGNMVLNAEMRLRASLFRSESRGCHYREDYPRRDDHEWLAWVLISEEDGHMALRKEPVPAAWHPDPALSYEERYPLRYPGE